MKGRGDEGTKWRREGIVKKDIRMGWWEEKEELGRMKGRARRVRRGDVGRICTQWREE